MKNKITFLLAIVAVIMVFVGFYFVYQNTIQKSEEPNFEDSEAEKIEKQEIEKNKAPNFSFYDEDENEFELSDFFGEPIIINFWASWCPPCKAELPDFQELYDEKSEEIKFIMLNSTDGKRETVETASSFIKKNGYTFPIYYDMKFEGATAFQTYSIPVTIYIDKDGNVVEKKVGVQTKSELLKIIGE